MLCTRIGLYALTALLTAAPVYGQEILPPQQSTLTVHSRLIVLDVIVFDSKGNAVTNLDRDQFHITEDRIPQTIRNFEAPSAHAMPPASSNGALLVNSAADLPRIGAAPVNILVLDEVNTGYMQLAFARQMLERFLRQQPAVLPIPTLFLAAGSTRLAVLHDYTQSRDELLTSIHKHTTDADFSNLVSILNGGHAGASNGFSKTLGALMQVTESVRGIQGRKNVIWVGSGYNNADDISNNPTGDQVRAADALRLVTNRMLADRVTLYTLDPNGIIPHEDGAGAVAGNDNAGLPGDIAAAGLDAGPGGGFEDLAYATGGRVVFNRNDIDTQLATLQKQVGSYYTLTYQPATDLSDKWYVHVRVTLTDPSLHAVYRTGYFGGPDDPVTAIAPNNVKHQPRELLYELTSAARTTLAYTALHTTAERTSKGLTVFVRAPDLQFTTAADGTRQAEATVIAVCFDSHNKEIGQRAAELTDVLGPNDRTDDPKARVAFDFPFVVPGGVARIRIVVRDAATGKLGSVDLKP